MLLHVHLYVCMYVHLIHLCLFFLSVTSFAEKETRSEPISSFPFTDSHSRRWPLTFPKGKFNNSIHPLFAICFWFIIVVRNKLVCTFVYEYVYVIYKKHRLGSVVKKIFINRFELRDSLLLFVFLSTPYVLE